MPDEPEAARSLPVRSELGANVGLPTGTVTFLLTDVKDSTRLWEAARDHMGRALARHDAIIEEAVTEHGGAVVRPRGEGDSRFAVFQNASAAVTAAMRIQVALHHEDWQLPTPLQVRMALHTGEADLRNGDYYGSAMNRCARLRALAHGGQVLVSATTAAFAGHVLTSDTRLRSVGTYALKDLNEPEHIFQLVHPGLPDRFPPLQFAVPHCTAQPTAPHTPLVGRERDIRELVRLAFFTNWLGKSSRLSRYS